MTSIPPEPIRWRQRQEAGPATEVEVEGRAGMLVRAVPDPSRPSEAVLARIRADVLASQPGATIARVPVRLALTAMLVFLSATAAGGALLLRRSVGREPAAGVPISPPHSPDKVRPKRHIAPRYEVAAPAAAVPPAPARTSAPQSEGTAPSARSHSARPGGRVSAGAIAFAKPVATPAQQTSTTARTIEARAIARALTQLRTEGAPQAALATLDDYSRQFPDGALSSEARLARLEAFVRMKDFAGALRLMDDTVLSVSQPLQREQLIVRGELRANVGRDLEGLRDFDAALSSPTSLSREQHERALYGRALCRERTGDVAGARADFESYLNRFPQGPSAQEVRRLVKEGTR